MNLNDWCNIAPKKNIEKSTKAVLVKKSLNEELKQALFVVLVPDEVDLQGDTYDEDTVRKACHNFNTYCRKANLFHVLETDSFSFVESFTAPVDMQIQGTNIKKGTWLAVTQFHNDNLWEGVKKGDYNGLSIGAKALVEYLEE